MTTPKAGQFVECLLSMVCDMQEASEISTQSQWTDSIDKGGLLHIQFLQSHGIVHTETLYLPHHLKTVTDDENVQYYWHILTIDNSDAEDADELHT